MHRTLRAIVVVALVVFGCKNQEIARETHDKALIESVTQSEKTVLDQQAAAQTKAETTRKEAEDDAATKKAAAAASAAEEKTAALKTDIQQHPGKYLEFSGMEYFDKGIVPGDRRLRRVSGTNKSPYTLRIADAQLTGLDGAGVRITSAPLSLSGTIPPGRTRTFEEADIRSGTIQANAQDTHIDVAGVEIIDVAAVAAQ